MEENKVVETVEVEKTEEVVEVIDEKKEKRKKLIKRILIGLAGAGAVIGAGALLLKNGENVDDDVDVIERNSPFDLAARAEYGGEGDTEVKFMPAGDPRENLWKATPKTAEDAQTETTEE